MKPILIVSDKCPECAIVKKYIADNGIESDIEIVDASTPEGMAEVAMMELAEKKVPLLVVPTVLRDMRNIIMYLGDEY